MMTIFKLNGNVIFGFVNVETGMIKLASDMENAPVPAIYGVKQDELSQTEAFELSSLARELGNFTIKTSEAFAFSILPPWGYIRIGPDTRRNPLIALTAEPEWFAVFAADDVHDRKRWRPVSRSTVSRLGLEVLYAGRARNQ